MSLGFSGSDAWEEPIGTQWQLDLVADLTAGFGRCASRGRHGHVLCLTQDADDFSWRRTFSHAQGQWQSSSNTVSRSRVRESLKEAGDLCWDLLAGRVIAEFYDARTSILCSSLSFGTVDLRDGICHNQNKEQPLTMC